LDAGPTLDQLLVQLVGALENVRDVLANAIQNFPGLDRSGEFAVAIRQLEGHSAYVRAQMRGESN
jgi:hypothetical protein